MSVLRLDDVTKVFGSGAAEVTAVADATLELAKGELVLIMGPSGAGKSTLLQLCGALLRPTTGTVWLDGIEVTALTESRLPDVRLKKVGFVFQAFQLLANLNALENVRLVLEAAGKAGADARARELLGSLGLDHRLSARPATLSGGEKQRVALGRCITRNAELFLVDEPFANLDQALREKYRVNLKSLLRQFHITRCT